MKLFLSMEYQCQLFHIEMRDSHRNFSKRLGIFGTKPNLSIEYHPQTDGQSERMIQIIEDMLRACSLNFKRSWDDHLPLVEFAYNNSYHSSIGMTPFEALYGRNCRSPLCQDEVGEKKILKHKIVQHTKQSIEKIQKRFVGSSRQTKEICRFGKKGEDI